MKTINLTLTILFISFVSFGQGGLKDAKITLKNGSIIYGDIIDASFVVETRSGSKMTIQDKDVKSIQKNASKSATNTTSPNSNVSSEQVKDYFVRYLKQKKRTKIVVSRIAKNNGIKKKINGQDIYEFEYTLTLRTKSNIYISPHINLSSNGFLSDFGYLNSNPTGYDAIIYPNVKTVKGSTLIKVTGIMFFEKTDNGWRVRNFKNKNYRIL